MIGRRTFLAAAGVTLLLAGCSEQTRRVAPRAITAGEQFALVEIAGRAIVIGIVEWHVTRLFDLGIAASDVTWARWSTAFGGAVLALVSGNGRIDYWMAERSSDELRPLPGSSDAGDAVASGHTIWQIGPGSRISTRSLDDRDRHERRLPFAIPTRITVSGGRVFVLGQTTDGRPIACDVSGQGATLASWRIPRRGQLVDLAVIGTEICVSMVPDDSATGSDQSSELLILDRASTVIARRRLGSAGLLTTIRDGVAVVDSRLGGRFVVACRLDGGELWQQKLPTGAEVLSLAAIRDGILAVQEDAISVVSGKGIRRLPLSGHVISQN